MANTSSAKKRIRSSLRKRDRNRRFRSTARTYIKNSRELINKGNLEAAEEMAQKAVTTLDKAARKGILHPRNAARRKSRLMKKLAKARAKSA